MKSEASTDPLARVLSPQADRAYTLLCVVTGLLFAFHGAQKLFGWFLPPGVEISVFSQAWIGGVIELVTGLMIAVGVRTTWAAFLASGTMAVAYTQFHWKLGLGAQLLPAVNGGELALVYAFLFLYIACRGGRPLWASRRT
ncbi:MAG: DoxX family protein [Myxococcota bacterium]|nr:DoxX family protein [Myxococcota bacterium]